jgi:hypothetical protein
MRRFLQQGDTERNLCPQSALRNSPRGLEANGRLIRSGDEIGTGVEDLPRDGCTCLLGKQMEFRSGCLLRIEGEKWMCIGGGFAEEVTPQITA